MFAKQHEHNLMISGGYPISSAPVNHTLHHSIPHYRTGEESLVLHIVLQDLFSQHNWMAKSVGKGMYFLLLLLNIVYITP